MRFTFWVMLLVYCVPIASANAYERGVFKQNEAAIELLKQQKYESALELLLQAAEQMPSSKVIRKNIATAYLGAGQKQIHVRNYAQAAQTNGKLFDFEELKGEFRAIDSKRIGLAYEQSYSFVRYLIERFGWYQMAELLLLFKGGSNAPDAMATVYGDYGASFSSLKLDWQRQL